MSIDLDLCIIRRVQLFYFKVELDFAFLEINEQKEWGEVEICLFQSSKNHHEIWHQYEDARLCVFQMQISHASIQFVLDFMGRRIKARLVR